MSPYIRSLNAADKFARRSAAYDAAASRARSVLEVSKGRPRPWLKEQRAIGIGSYSTGMYTGHGRYNKLFDKVYKSRAMKHVGNSLLRTGLRKFDEGMVGMGAYNSLVNNGGAGGGAVTDSVPSFCSADDETGALTVTHREYVADLYAPGVVGGPAIGFANQSYALNPGLEQSFPWLSQIAANYEEFEFQQLMYTYRSTTTDIGNSSNGQCGTVILATNYNASSQPFGDKITMMEYDGAMSAKVTEHLIHGIECDPEKLSSAQGKYVRTGPVQTGQDIKTYDQGLFQFATANTPSTLNGLSLGEIWVSYTVRLRKPRFYVNRGLAQDQDIFVGQAPFAATSWMGPMGSLLKAQNNNIGCLLSYNGANQLVITFPANWAGQVRIRLTLQGTVITTQPLPSGAVTGNVVVWQDMYGSAGQPVFAQYSTSSTFSQCSADYRIGAATGGVNNTIVIANPAFTTCTAAAVEIFEMNGGFSASNGNPAIPFVNSAGVLVTPV